MRRLEQIMGEVSHYAPPEEVHKWQHELQDLLEYTRQQAVNGVYYQLESFGAWVQPH